MVLYLSEYIHHHHHYRLRRKTFARFLKKKLSAQKKNLFICIQLLRKCGSFIGPVTITLVELTFIILKRTFLLLSSPSYLPAFYFFIKNFCQTRDEVPLNTLNKYLFTCLIFIAHYDSCCTHTHWSTNLIKLIKHNMKPSNSKKGRAYFFHLMLFIDFKNT